MRKARKESIFPDQIQIVHTYNRCVRRAHLCGFDPVTGNSYDHRKGWARDRLEHLACCFAIDVIAYAMMPNHSHQVLRSRPDVAKEWTAHEVAYRWLSLSPKYDKNGNVKPPQQKKINAIAADRKRVEELRIRLSDISWWMRYYSQNIAVRCNREDGVKGHFWEERFNANVLEEDADVLACMIYVDLNPIRAKIADAIEDSNYTSGKDRLDDLRLELFENDQGTLTLTETGSETHQWERLGGDHSGWLSPIEINERIDPIGPDSQPAIGCSTTCINKEMSLAKFLAAAGARQGSNDAEFTELSQIRLGRRASRKGVLPISVARYLELLEEAGRCVRDDKPGAIDKALAPLLQRLGIKPGRFAQSLLTVNARCRKYNSAPPATLVLMRSSDSSLTGAIASPEQPA